MNPYYMCPPPSSPDPYEAMWKLHKRMVRQEEVRKRKFEEDEKKKYEKKSSFSLFDKKHSTLQVFLLLCAISPFIGPITVALLVKNLAMLRDTLVTTLK